MRLNVRNNPSPIKFYDDHIYKSSGSHCFSHFLKDIQAIRQVDVIDIIKLEKHHIRHALDLVWTVFQEFVAPDYSAQGIEAYRKFISYKSMMEKVEEEELHFWGCMMNDELIGVIAIREMNHICLLFVKKEYHRQGIARCLCQKVIERCKEEKNNSKLTVNSSPYALGIYHRLGFVESDKEQTINGIRFTPMSYFLT